MKVIRICLLTWNFVKGENHKHLKNTLICKAKQFMLTNVVFFFLEKSIYFRRRCKYCARPRAKLYLHLAGLRPSHASFTDPVFLPASPWEPLFPVGSQCDNIIQVDITFIIPKLIDKVPSHAKGA